MAEKYKALVVDDAQSDRKLIARVVEKHGFEVTSAENGRAGLEAFKEHGHDAVITDIKMPQMDGIELMCNIKKDSPDVPFILVTAHGDNKAAIKALSEGALDYIEKPIDRNVLAVALGRAKEKIDEHRKEANFPLLLLAEDDISARKHLSRTLRKEGWQVFEAGDGEMGLKIFQESKIDIALLDIRMPKMDGLTLMRKMREVTDDFETVVLTGYGDESTIIEAMRQGAASFLKKPIDLDELMLVVTKTLEKLNLRRCLKYRTRELELAKEIMASSTDSSGKGFL